MTEREENAQVDTDAWREAVRDGGLMRVNNDMRKRTEEGLNAVSITIVSP